ncbi:hypothetical protein LT85_1768 [Collimonas arenae]|uniref:Uncharacterized protein n=1 Tax=Collimonas arenae TaxID=279058 RepID=A0A0A1F8T1_9BURK|nr:hypothetical protein [Collimonas arenae]AIY40926.1 hypothetical protein LT85_1768 [Collimonas arenae]
MNKSNLAWLIAALVLGLGGIYAVWAAEDSSAADHDATVVAAQDHGVNAAGTSEKPKDAVNINPFGK